MMMDNQRSANYYEIWFDDSNPLAMVSESEDLKGVDRWLVYSGMRVECWPDSVTFYVEGKDLEDYLFSALHGWVLISDRARKAIERCVSADSIQFLPIMVESKSTGEKVAQYWLIQTLRLVDGLDWKNSRWLHPGKQQVDPHPALDLVKVALNKQAIADTDLFRLKIKDDVRGLYCSDKVKHALEEAKSSSGFRFLFVPIYPSNE